MEAIAIFDPNSSFNKAKVEGWIKFSQKTPFSKTLIQFNVKVPLPYSNKIQIGVHIHESGNLLKGCESLCKHFNPKGVLHGSIGLKDCYGDQRHVGDLINNLILDRQGKFVYEYFDELVDLFGPDSVIGRSIVIHENIDDGGKYRCENTKKGKESGITGNAGSRIACSIIGII